MHVRRTLLAIVVLRVLLGPVLGSFAVAQDASESRSTLVVVISGFGSDASAAQLAGKAPRGKGTSGMYQLMRDLEDLGLSTEFFNWNGTSAGRFKQKDAPGASEIVSFIRAENAKSSLKNLVIIGHSWGGHTMMEVAQQLCEDPQIEIQLAIAVDPSSLSRGKRAKELPRTVNKLVNYHTRNAFVWGEWKSDERIQNIDLGDPANGFKAINGSSYAAKFDIHAHNAAEWDKLIHKDIVKRIESLVGSSKTSASGSGR
ncbi:MAG: hypothetical protein Aurels2KO_45890 [Aureliella sp.]